MATEYTDAEDIRPTIAKLIAENDITFSHLTPRMFLLTRRTADKAAKWNSKTTIVAKKLRHLLGNKVFQIEIDHLGFDTLNDNQKEAELFHALCHTFLNEKGVFKILDHDIQDFNQVVEKYGGYMPEVVRFVNAVRTGNSKSNVEEDNSVLAE